MLLINTVSQKSAMRRHKNEGDEKWERKPIKKRWIIPNFYDVPWLIFETLWPATFK